MQIAVFTTIVSPTSCEVRAVIRCLYAKGFSAAETHRELCLLYGPTVVHEGKFRQWGRFFENGRDTVHDEEQSGRHSTQTDEIVEQMNKNCEMIGDWHLVLWLMNFLMMDAPLSNTVDTQSLYRSSEVDDDMQGVHVREKKLGAHEM